MKGPPKNIPTREPKPSKLLRLVIEHRLRLAERDLERARETEAPLVKPLVKHRFR
ncbi:MAG: hypothetical protein H0V89_11280 [Deltaproteobacteria bacterium]|nr:hypothetical protein [Deltaproteobacteria bacterium]